MKPTRRGFLKMLGAAAASPAIFPLEIKDVVPSPPPPTVPPAPTPSLSQWSRGITIRALPSNTGMVYVGPSLEIARDHSKACLLEPGSLLSLEFVDPNRIFVDMEVDGDTVHILDGYHLESRG